MKVFCNLAVSLDGKIADRHAPTKALGTPYDRQRMDQIRRLCDVIVVGAETLRAHPKTMRLKKRGRQPANAVVTATGELDANWDFWKDTEVTRFVFTTTKGFPKALAAAGERAFVVAAGNERVNPQILLERLKSSNLKNVLVEGGGTLVSEFLAPGLLHEMYVTLTPWLLGGRDNPSLVGGSGLEPWARLKMLKMKRVGEEFYFHYRVKGSRRV